MANEMIVGGSPKPAPEAHNDHLTPEERATLGTVYEPRPPAQTELHPLDVALREPFRLKREALTDVGFTLEQVQQRERDVLALVRETGLDPYSEVPLLYDLVVAADIADQRGEPFDEAQEQAWREESYKGLREEYGQRDAEMWLGRAAKYAREHPKLAAQMQRRGIGSRPEVLKAIVEHVRRVDYR